MKNLALRVMLLLSVLSLAVPALLAQNATQSDQSDQSKNEQKSPEYVYRTTTRLVILDIVATDSKGNIVTDLKPEEIQILDNGKEQAKVDFSFIHPNGEKPRHKWKCIFRRMFTRMRGSTRTIAPTTLFFLTCSTAALPAWRMRTMKS